jgi:hypothetical protein
MVMQVTSSYTPSNSTTGAPNVQLPFQLIQTANSNVAQFVKSGTGTGTLFPLENDGTGNGISFKQVGVLAGNKAAVYVYDDTADQTTGLGIIAGVVTRTGTTIPPLYAYNVGHGDDIGFKGRATTTITRTTEGGLSYDTTLHAYTYYNGTSRKTLATV